MQTGCVALRKESVDRNWKSRRNRNLLLKSLSARRAWIEMRCCAISCITEGVALRKESVDRNIIKISFLFRPSTVALRKESVDRNNVCGWCCFRLRRVALRKESVDRNNTGSANFRVCIVALRKESVDRNAWIPYS